MLPASSSSYPYLSLIDPTLSAGSYIALKELFENIFSKHGRINSFFKNTFTLGKEA
jgi:hypothetical protein